jgi:hypothetical protein
MVAPFQWPWPCTNCIGPITPILISCPKATVKDAIPNKKTIANVKIPFSHLSIWNPSFLEIKSLITAIKSRLLQPLEG